MTKQAPTSGAVIAIVAFAFSCFAIGLFLWKAFGGITPLEPQGYRFEVAFPEATQFAVPIDVRASGVTIGELVETRVEPPSSRTVATIELDEAYAPLPRTARAVLRTKTLLGERYVEMTLGDRDAPELPDGGRLPDGQVRRTVELDEVLSAFDRTTRRSFQVWQQAQAGAVRGRGQDLNDALGNLPEWAASSTDLLSVLNEQKADVRRLFRNTGVVFSTLARDQAQLRRMMVASERAFGAMASEDRALAETFRIFPTFLDESKRTFANIEAFSPLADPVIQQLRPAARELRPTLRAARALAPDFRTAFARLDPLIDASRTGLPALRDTLGEVSPLLGQLQPFLEELNPILEWLEYMQPTVSDALGAFFFLGNTVTTTSTADGVPGHFLKILATNSPDNVITHSNRPPGHRGNAYRFPTGFNNPEYLRRQIIASFDCDNTGKPGNGEYQTELPNTDDDPSCWVQPPPLLPLGNTRRAPHIEAADYSR